MSREFSELTQTQKILIFLLQSLGFAINLKKGQMTPAKGWKIS